jgi:hypothetical protein
MEKLIADNSVKTIAYIIAIEDYSFADGSMGISPVKFARNDATAFKQTLIEHMGVLEGDITIWLDQQATKSAFENDLKYEISRLEEDERLIIYYAGHGFWNESGNRLSCWDTHGGNLLNTTVSLKEVLFDPLEKSRCKRALIFLDCCARHISDTFTGRDMLANFSTREIEDFLAVDSFHAVLMSCQPGQASYPHAPLGHGIWTYHLLKALSGEVPDAIYNSAYITDRTLQNYLRVSVPAYIKKETDIRAEQTPYAKISASNEFLIRKIDQPNIAEDENQERGLFNVIDASFVAFSEHSVREGKGFKSGHHVPNNYDPTTQLFVSGVFEENLQEEIQGVYERAKLHINLKKKDTSRGKEDGFLTLSCPYFKFKVSCEQIPSSHQKAWIKKILQFIVPYNLLPAGIDGVFSPYVFSILLNAEMLRSFDDTVEALENSAESFGGVVTDNEAKKEIKFTSKDKLDFKFNMSSGKLLISSSVKIPLSVLIQRASQVIEEINPNTQKDKAMELSYMDQKLLLSKLADAALKYFERLFVPDNPKLAKAKIEAIVAEWEKQVISYHSDTVETFNPDQMAIYEEFMEDFRNNVFGKELWTVKAALKTPDPDLARYKRDFKDADASDVYETVAGLLTATATYVTEHASTLNYDGVTEIEELGIDFLNEKDMLLNKVIGYGIRSELLHRYYPAHLAIMTQKSLWGMHFLLEGDDKEFIVVETNKFQGKIRVSHNWQYPYDRFTFLMNAIAIQLQAWVQKYGVSLKPEYRFGYVNMFLSAIYDSRKADVRLLHEWVEK